MAEISLPRRPSDEEFRINCRSQRSVKKIENTINAQIRALIDRNKLWTEEEKNRTKMRFQEIFEKTLRENVLIRNQPFIDASEEADETSEIEPFNHELKRSMNMELLPELDDAIVTNAMKRKNCPISCATNCAKMFKYEKEYYSRIKCAVPEENLAFVTPEIPTEKETSDALQTSLQTLHSLTQELPDLSESMIQLRAATSQVLAEQQRTPLATHGENSVTCRKLNFPRECTSAGRESAIPILLPRKLKPEQFELQ